jgi:hypothetical protein
VFETPLLDVPRGSVRASVRGRWLPAIVAAKRHLGHSSIVVTMDRYGHLFPSEDAALAERLDKAFRESQTDRRRTDSSTNTVRIVP